MHYRTFLYAFFYRLKKLVTCLKLTKISDVVLYITIQKGTSFILFINYQLSKEIHLMNHLSLSIDLESK